MLFVSFCILIYNTILLVCCTLRRIEYRYGHFKLVCSLAISVKER